MAGTFHSLMGYFFSIQAHEDGGYIKLIVKEECKDCVPGPVQRVLKSFHTEVRGNILVFILETILLVEEAVGEGGGAWNLG